MITAFRKVACSLILVIVVNSLSANGIDQWLEDLSNRLIFESPKRDFQAQLSGLVDLELYYIDQHPPGLLFIHDKHFFNPRLTLFLDAFWGEKIYGFAKFRWDRGFDPGYKKEGQARMDEYFLRYTFAVGGVNVQAGTFATQFGNWAGRHDSWENPFINAPLPYENITTVFDRKIIPDRQFFLSLRNFNDVKKNWIPIIWGPAYTAGVSIFGETGKFSYAIALKNAALSSRPGVWNDLDWDYPTWTGSVSYRPNEAWNIGASASAGPYLQASLVPLLPPGRSIDDFNQVTLGGDFSWARRHWQVWGEIIHSEFDVPNVGTVGTTAYYIEAKYKWSPRLFTAFRWNQQFFDKIDDGAGSQLRWDRGMTRFETAIGYRLNRNIQFKAQYSFSDQNGSLEQGQQFAATQITIKF